MKRSLFALSLLLFSLTDATAQSGTACTLRDITLTSCTK